MNRDLFSEVRPVRAALCATVALGLVAAVVTIAQMALLSHVVAQVFLAHAGLARVERPLFLLLAVIVARAAVVWLREVTAQRGAIRVKSALRERLFAHLLALGPAFCRGERTGELVATAVEGVERLDAYVSRYLPQVALSVGVPLLIAGYILPLDWASGVLLLVTGPIIPLLMVLVGSYAQAQMRRQWTALSRLSAHVLDAVQGLPTLIVFGQSAAEQDRIARVSDRFRDRTMAVLRLAFLSGLVLELMASVAIALVAVTLGVRLLDGGISFERALLVLLLAPEFYRPLRELGAHRHAGMEGAAAAERIMAILRTPLPAPGDRRQATGDRRQRCICAVPAGHMIGLTRVAPPLYPAADGVRCHATAAARLLSPVAYRLSPGCGYPLTITLSGVRYTYPGSARPALDGVSLTLPAGACTALVGRSGAGKSTLVNLLLRFAEADGGEIAVNGMPLCSLPVELWREYVALVPQRPYLFHGSVRDNIRLARPAASDAEVARAAELAGATEFIARLPRGYDTPIGERGARLSAGQAQRLAIARAFLKDAPVLILDEPTSSLDPASERLIRAAVQRLMHDRTVLVVAHRLATIDRSEGIAVLDQGRLVECGRHAELLRRGGLYAGRRGAGSAMEAPV